MSHVDLAPLDGKSVIEWRWRRRLSQSEAEFKMRA